MKIIMIVDIPTIEDPNSVDADFAVDLVTSECKGLETTLSNHDLDCSVYVDDAFSDGATLIERDKPKPKDPIDLEPRQD